jgi:hypothetical protein
VILRHNGIRDELAGLAAKAFIPSTIRNEPLIHSSCPAVKMPVLVPAHPSVNRNLRKNRSADRGDLSIRGLWQRGTDCIIDVRVTDTDAKSNLSKDPAKVLEAHEKKKRGNTLRLALRNDVILHHSWSPPMASSARKRSACLRRCPLNWLRNGRSRGTQ